MIVTTKTVTGEQIIVCNECGESVFLSKAWRTAQSQMSNFRKKHVCVCPADGTRLVRGECPTCEAARRLGADENEPAPMNMGDW